MSLTSPRRLPDEWVRKIFATMQGHYGTRFLNMWKTGQITADGNDAGMLNAMDQWSLKLGGYRDNPETIKKALQHLPNDPPSLPQFVELMRQSWVPPDIQRLENRPSPEEHQRSREYAAEALARMREIAGRKLNHEF